MIPDRAMAYGEVSLDQADSWRLVTAGSYSGRTHQKTPSRQLVPVPILDLYTNTTSELRGAASVQS